MIFYGIDVNDFWFLSKDAVAHSGLRLKGLNMLGRNLSFTVDLLISDTENVPKDFCYLNSSEKLRDLILSCVGKAVIREPTQKEIEQVQQYRAKQQGEHLL